MPIDLHFGRLNAWQALRVSADCREHWPTLRALQPRLKLEPSGPHWWILVNSPSEQHRAQVAACEALLKACNDAGAPIAAEDLRAPREPDLPALADCLGVLALNVTEIAPGDAQPMEPVADLSMVLAPLDRVPGLEAALAELTRADSAPLIDAAFSDDGLWGFFWFEADARRGSYLSLLADLRRRFDAFTLCGWATGAGLLLLPEERSVTDAVAYAFSRAWRNLRDQPLGPGRALAVFIDTTDSTKPYWQIECDLPASPSGALETSIPTTVDIFSAELTSTPEALRALNAQIAKASPSAGYRLQLEPMPTRVRQGETVEALERQRDEIEEKIDVYRAMERSRPRLMRFAFDQLPALADFITRLPIEAVDRGRVRYAFQTTIADRAGCHWLCYDPGEALEQAFFPYWHWQADPASPIVFAVDPYWRLEALRESRTEVFVPDGYRLNPPLRAAVAVDFDGYVREQLRLWTQHGGARFTIPDAPYVVFGPAPEARRLTVDVLDRDAFQPLSQRLPWINDNLILREAVEGDSFVAEAARHAGRVAILNRLENDADAAHARLDADAADLQASLRHGLAELLNRLAVEIETTADRTTQAVRSIEHFSARLIALDEIVHDALKIADRAEDTARKIPPTVSALEGDRRRIAAQLRATLNRADHMHAAAERRMQTVQRRLQALRQRLDDVW